MQIFHNTNYDFIRWRWHALILSSTLIIGGLVFALAKGGVPLGIDFSGGTMVVLQFDQPVHEDVVLQLAGVGVRRGSTDLLAGIVSKVVVLGADLFGANGRMVRGVLPHVNTLGNAAVGAYFHTRGAGYGAQASGVKRLILPAGQVDAVKKAFPSATVLGAIPKAPHGDFLSAAELAEMARG
jgi:hypothetical protein